MARRSFGYVVSALAIGAAALGLSACSSATATTAATVTLRSETVAPLGHVLAGNSGRTLYYLTLESSSRILCVGSCNTKWFPYIVAGSTTTVQGAGVNGSVASTIRPDGQRQLTFSGHPVYFYYRDHATGQARGEGVDGTWFVLNPVPEGAKPRSTTTTTGTPLGNPYGY